MSSSVMGPPKTKFNHKNVDAIVKAIGDGVPYKIASEANAVAYNTLLDWIKNGVRDIQKGIDSEYVNLVRSVRSIEMKRIQESMAKIKNSDKGHRGAEWMMERCFWRYFSAQAANVDMNDRLDKLEQKDEDNVKI